MFSYGLQYMNSTHASIQWIDVKLHEYVGVLRMSRFSLNEHLTIELVFIRWVCLCKAKNESDCFFYTFLFYFHILDIFSLPGSECVCVYWKAFAWFVAAESCGEIHRARAIKKLIFPTKVLALFHILFIDILLLFPFIAHRSLKLSLEIPSRFVRK